MTVLSTFFLAHWFHFNYLPVHEPFYQGAVWGNVFVILVLAPLGWIWAKTKFWPLHPLEKGLHHLHQKMDASIAHHEAHADLLQQHTEKIDHAIQRIEDLHSKIESQSASAEPDTENQKPE